MNNKILNEVESYYTKKVKEFGATPKGVDWNSEESQVLRFDILSQVINSEEEFSILDYGCGFGSMLTYMAKKYEKFNFTGFDISEEMINTAKRSFINDKRGTWKTSLENTSTFDYTVASGIFNIKLENSNEEWETYIFETLDKINNHSLKGFSFNILTKYSDREYMKDYLFYADPLLIFDYCKKNFSKNVALLHDYNLYEFTIIVRK
jgi:cyclopropane fatty-acyl-phospholipid synthase-like methyltransferase